MISVVQSTGKFRSSSSVASITSSAFGTQPTVGNYIIVAAAAAFGSDPNPWAFSDNQGNSYSVARTSAANNLLRVAIGYAKITTSSGSFTVTVDPNGSSFITGCAIEVAGLDGTAPLDQVNSNTGTSNSPTPGSITTTVADELIVAIAGDRNGTTTTTEPGAPWVLVFEEEAGNSFVRASMIYQIASATGSFNPQWTLGALLM